VELPKRKNTRLRDYDYSQNGAYYVTVCTKDRWNLLGKMVGNEMVVGKYGEFVSQTWFDLENHNAGIILDKMIIMPNHFHGIIQIVGNGSKPFYEQEPGSHGIPEIIRQLKTFSSKRINEYRRRNGLEPFPTGGLWQKSYHDHIIRNQDDYLRIWQYIDENPAKWAEDEYYCVEG